jgi:Bacterial low temperature requirement A protein (LtrA)/Anti-sigma-K factor rskA
MPGERHSQFKRWFSRPPRPHGAILFDRRVSFLEVFYDLAYVAVIGQASHQLAANISVRGVVEFAIIFGLIWFAWINGSLYVELHGGEDGRTRNIVFVQMCILALLAVLTAEALPALGDGSTYQAWTHEEGQWVSLGTVAPDSDGAAHLIAENSALTSPPDSVEITIEPAGGSQTPSDSVALRWLPA